MGRRVLVTGLASFWGGRMAQALEASADVDVIIGLDTEEPRVELERTEFVRADQSYSILARLVRATAVDTVLHTFLVVDSTHMRGRALHETNVIGTMNLLAAASAPGTSVRDLVVKSSTLVYGSTERDPYWFREEHRRSGSARTRVERSLLEVEDYLSDFADDNPNVCVRVLRFANVLGSEIVTPISRLLELPVVPAIAGFDPLLQFVEEIDVIRSIQFVLEHHLAGVFNVAGDGKLPWSECASIVGRPMAPVLPPYFTDLVAKNLGRLHIADLPPEVLSLLRHGRGVDNSRLQEAGFGYRFTSAGAVDSFAQALRLRRATDLTGHNYRYERDVENFFRHSPAVVRNPEP
jgi:UDP-glucose 4-epimerase